MKKALVFLMTAVMALNVCACGGKAETAKQETAEEKTVEEEAAVDTAAQEEEAFKPEKPCHSQFPASVCNGHSPDEGGEKRVSD